jgi:putative ABC transport system permease protein
VTPLAIRSYRTLIRWLPASVRDAYGDEMLELFTEQWSAARQTGRLRAMAVWGRSVWDALRQVPREHWLVAGRYSHEESMHTFLSDLRFAARSFSRQRGATLLVLLTLTLAVAANTGVFLLLDDLFFRPFPFRDPASLVYLNERAPKWNLEFTGVNFPDFDGWRKRTHSFDALGLIAAGNFNLAVDGAAERVQGASVTWDLPRVLGIRPILGRAFTAADDRPNGPNVVMIGSGFWRTRFGGARDVVGKTIRLDSAPFTVIGVLPDAAEFPGGVQLWTPLNGDTGQKFTSYAYEGIGRLKPGVTIERARADLLAAQEPIWRERDTAHVVSPRIMPLREWFVAEYRTTGQVLGLGVVLVLLIACANVAGAMLARTSFRKRELAIRAALGASARRIARQMLTESLLLATIAGVVGTAAGWWGIRALLFASPDQLPPWVHLEFSWRIAGFSIGIIAIITALFGAGPAIDARRQGVRAALAAGDLRTSASPGQRRMLSALVVAEVALATVLLVSGGLLVRAYTNLKAVDPGFRADGVAEFRLALPQAKYDDGPKQRRLYEALIERLSAIPGVVAAGGVSCLPFTCHWGNFYTAEGSALKPGGQNPVILTRVASPGYFAAMGIQTVHGRTYLASEQRPLGELFPVVVNAEFARLHWPDATDPVGKRIAASGSKTNPWMTVIGVVKDVRHYGLSEPMRPGIYLPMSFLDSTQSVASLGFAVRTSGNPVAIFPAIRSVLHEIDPELPVYQLRTLQDALDASLMGRRSLMIVLAAFAAIALTLALGGIYAILSYVVGRRRREIGIRMALGAQRGQVIRMVVMQGAGLMSAGLLIGLPLAFASTRILTSLLVGVSASDPLTYVVVTGLLGLTSIVAAFAPARRAASVNPTSVLADGG